MRIAVFDIGTNSIHMKIVEINPDLSFEVLEHEKDMTRIGELSFQSKKLSEGAMKRALKVLTRFVRIAKSQRARRMIAVATSAVRDAKNGSEFMKLVYKKTGLRARVISGREEARLIFLGVSSGLEKSSGKILIIDIGGGSAEFILGDRKKIYYDTSFPLGVARLTDRYITKDPPSKENLRNLEEYIDEKISEVIEAINRKKFKAVVGTGGTIINLASIAYESEEGRPLRLRGYFKFRKEVFLKLHKKMITMREKQIKKLPGLDRKRSDIIVAGGVFTALLFKRLKIGSILVSDKGIREGLILDHMMRSEMNLKRPKPSLKVQWFGQKPFFSGKILG